MIALIQRVIRAEVRITGQSVGAIGPGILAFIGMERTDNPAQAGKLLDRMLSYRMFTDAEGRMNLSLLDTGGGLLLVPQFTLAADTRKGTRASFSSAAAPQEAQRLYEHLVQLAGARLPVQTGHFGADMQVELVNDGPVTFWLQVRGTVAN